MVRKTAAASSGSPDMRCCSRSASWRRVRCCSKLLPVPLLRLFNASDAMLALGVPAMPHHLRFVLPCRRFRHPVRLHAGIGPRERVAYRGVAASACPPPARRRAALARQPFGPLAGVPACGGLRPCRGGTAPPAGMPPAFIRLVRIRQPQKCNKRSLVFVHSAAYNKDRKPERGESHGE